MKSPDAEASLAFGSSNLHTSNKRSSPPRPTYGWVANVRRAVGVSSGLLGERRASGHQAVQHAREAGEGSESVLLGRWKRRCCCGAVTRSITTVRRSRLRLPCPQHL